jgi:ElaB/YqjD/DUF883 family membrane-anchored ribosome-binding protein
MSHGKDHLKRTIGETADMARDSAERLADQAGEFASDVRDYASHIFDRSREGYRQAAKSAERGLRQARGVMRDNPGLTISAALGIGLLAGVIIGISLGSDRGWR